MKPYSESRFDISGEPYQFDVASKPRDSFIRIVTHDDDLSPHRIDLVMNPATARNLRDVLDTAIAEYESFHGQLTADELETAERAAKGGAR